MEATNDDSEIRQVRGAKNQSLFRAVNEQIERLHETFEREQAIGEPVEFLCECLSGSCEEKVRLTLAEYESVRKVPTHFVVCQGHEDLEIERVVAERDGFLVV